MVCPQRVWLSNDKAFKGLVATTFDFAPRIVEDPSLSPNEALRLAGGEVIGQAPPQPLGREECFSEPSNSDDRRHNRHGYPHHCAGCRHDLLVVGPR